MGQKGVGKAALKTERDKLALAIKTHRKEQQITKEKQKQNKVEKDSAKVKKTPIPRHSGAALGPSSPVNVTNQGTVIPGPSTVPKKAAGGSGVLSGALISGAFPLLFGQGPLGAAAGFTGGMIGGKLGGQTGGFAGGLIATAALTQVQQIIDGVAAVGNAFSETSLDINQVTKSLGLVGTPSAKYLQILEKTQGKQAAYNESVKRLSRIVGDEGVKNLQEFGDASRQFANDMSVLMTRLAAAFAGFANKVSNEGIFGMGGISKFTKPFERANLLNRAELSDQSNVQDLIAKRDAMLGGKTGGAAGKVKRTAAFKELENKIINQQKLNEELQKESDLNQANELRFQNMTKSVTDRTLLLQETLKFGAEEAGIREKMREFDEQAKKANIEISNKKRDQYESALRLQPVLQKNFEIQKAMTDLIANNMGNAMKDLISGAQSFNDVMRNTLNNMASAFLNLGIFGNVGGSFDRGQGLLGRIFRAEGGPVKGGKSYVVGERGPEMFTPGVSGMVTPNHALGGSTNIVVNVDASGSNVEGDEQQGRELGRLISVAVQSELVNQKRPGGLLA